MNSKLICRRSRVAMLLGCAVLLFTAAVAFPSSRPEAGHEYAVARDRLADLRKSAETKKYRSYWMDCIKALEAVERKYPKSAAAGSACFDRADAYRSLYRLNRSAPDRDEALRVSGKCQSSYPRHARAPEALYHMVDLALENRDHALASEAIVKLSKEYPDSRWTGKAKTRLSAPVRGRSARQGDEREAAATNGPAKASAEGAAKPAVVKTIRHWSSGAYTRIVIDQNRTVAFEAKALKQPDRLVFDLLNARLSASLNREPLAVNNGILKQVRASQFAPDRVRIVLDLESIKSYQAFQLHDPERLVIDVAGVAGEPASGPQTAEAGRQDNQPGPEPSDSASADPQGGEGAMLSLSRQMGLKVRTIAIDAGHGGRDPGAVGKSGLKEKTITLDVARRLAVLVRERLGCNVVMTRDRDVFIPLDQRPFIAKAKGADLFVSIHVNANRKTKARGIETYIQGLQASDREAMATAARENAMSTKKLSELDSEIDKILRDLKQDNKLEESLQLAHTVQASLVETVQPVQKEVVNLGVKRAFFYVLINTQMPSILAEVGFITNPDEERQLRRGSYRQSIAEALYQGVKKYVDSRSPGMMGI